MSQNDTEQLHLVDALVDAHREVTNDYCHSHPERLFGGDLALNISIWIGFKQDAIKSSSNKDKQLAEGYRQEVVDMIEELENILGIS
jgi:hypothetical protein